MENDADDTVKLVRRMDIYLAMLTMDSDHFARLDASDVVDAIDCHECAQHDAREGV